MKMDMELRGFSHKTVKVYLKNVQVVSDFFTIDPEQLNYDQIREFLHHAIIFRKLSRSYVNSIYSALMFYFKFTLGRSWNMQDIPRVKQASKLPVALSPSQVQKLFHSVSNIKHKTMLITCYSAGLRVGELLNLKVTDIDSVSMKIRVQNGKGNKERYTILSQTNLNALRKYFQIYKPRNYLFANENTHQPLTTRTIQKVFYDHRRLLNFPEDATIHSLRHSFATHLLLSGTSIAVIQKLLGHAHISTTSIYLHLTNADLSTVSSPIDSWEVFHA